MASAFNLTAQLNLQGPTNVNAIVNNIRRQLGTISANVNINVDPNTARNIAGLNRSFTAFNATLATTTANANNAARAINALTASVGRSANPLNNLQRNLQNNANATQQLTQNLNTLQRNTRQVTNSWEEFGRQGALAVRRFAAFATVTGIIYRVGNAISSASKDFVEFNRELVRVAQVTGSSVSQLGGLIKEITALSTGLGVTSESLIQVSSTLAQAGLSARDTQKALKALALSALAPSFDSMNDTVEGSIALMRQFGISADQLESALGSVNAVAAKFAVEASDIITAIQRTGGVFAAASRGVSEGTQALNEFIAIFTSVRATTRESAETIATGLRTIFTRIQRKGTIEALQEFGVVLTDLQGKFVGPFEAVKRLSEGLSKLDPRDLRFAEIVEELGGFRQIGKVIPLIQQFATAQQALKVAQSGQASLALDAAIAQESVANKITKVREEFIALIRSIGQSQGFQTFVSLALDLTSALIRLADAAKNVLPAIAAVTAIRGTMGLASFARGFAGGIRGGGARGFATGGLVPGQGNTDTYSAMLTPGEFVIRKKAVERIGASNLYALNRNSGGPIPRRYAGAGNVKPVDTKQVAAQLQVSRKEKDFSGKATSEDLGTITSLSERISTIPDNTKVYGGAFLYPGANADLQGTLDRGVIQAAVKRGGKKIYDALSFAKKDRNIPAVQAISNELKEIEAASASKANFLVSTDSLSSSVSENIEGIILNKTIEAVQEGAKILAPKVGARIDEQGPSEAARILKQSNIDNVLGNVFEAMISNAGAPYDDTGRGGANDPFDFPVGLRGLAGQFGQIRGDVPTDAKTRFTGSNVTSLMNKVKNYEAKELLTRLENFFLTTNLMVEGNEAFSSSAPRGKAKELAGYSPSGLYTATRADLAKRVAARGVKKASGGSIEDTVPALLTPGEFVINRKAASRIGASRLHQLNRADRVRGYNKGGSVGNVQKFAIGGSADPGINQQVYKLAKQLVKNGLEMSDALAQARQRVEKAFGPSSPPIGTTATKTSSGLAYGAKTPSGSTIPLSQLQAQGITATKDVADIQADRLARRQAQAANRQQNQLATGFANYQKNLPPPPSFVQRNLPTLSSASNRAYSYMTRSRTGGAPPVGGGPVPPVGGGPVPPGGGPVPPVGGSPTGGQARPTSFLGRLNSQEGRLGRALNRVGPMGGMMLAMGGGAAIEGLASYAGGEKTETGRRISSMGGDALNYATLGATIGSMVGPLGTVIGGLTGAALGLATGFFKAQKATEEYTQSQKVNLSQQALEMSGKAIGAYAEKGGKERRQAAIESFQTSSAKEADVLGGIKRQEGESLQDYSRRRAQSQEEGAKQAEQLLEAEMTQTGQTFDELRKTMNPALFAELTRNIAESDNEYARTRDQYNKDIDKLRAEAGNNPAALEQANRLEEEKNLKLKELEVVIGRRVTSEKSSAMITDRVAAQQAALGIAIEKGIMSYQKAFDTMGQTFARAGFEREGISDRLKQIRSGAAPLTANVQDRDLNILQNPSAYTRAERQDVTNRLSKLYGPSMATAGRMSTVGTDISNIANQAVAGGADLSEIERILVNNIGAAFGTDTSLGRDLMQQVRDKIANAMEDQGQGKRINLNAIIDDALGGVMNVQESANKAQIEAIQNTIAVFKALEEAGSALVDIQLEMFDRENKVSQMMEEGYLQQREALGLKVTSDEKAQLRLQQSGRRAGLGVGVEATTPALMARRQQLQAMQGNLQGQIANAQANMTADPAASKQLLEFQTQLASVNAQLSRVDGELENLPQVLQENLNDVFSDMKERVAELQQQRESSIGLMETLATSTPQELMRMNETYAHMQSAMNGNVIGIQNSAVAQRAYYESLMKGEGVLAANNAAQAAYVNENKMALQMFDELAKVAGITGDQLTDMRVKLLENFLNASGLANTPMGQLALKQAKLGPEAAAKNDPQLLALQAKADFLRNMQIEAMDAANKNALEKQQQVLKNTVTEIMNQLQGTVFQLQVNVQAQANQAGVINPVKPAKGGLIKGFANGGSVSGPEGTDNILARLTSGEFVINKASAKKYGGLLRAINKRSGGLIKYLQWGGGTDPGDKPAPQKDYGSWWWPMREISVTPEEARKAREERRRQEELRRFREQAGLDDPSTPRNTNAQSIDPTDRRMMPALPGPTRPTRETVVNDPIVVYNGRTMRQSEANALDAKYKADQQRQQEEARRRLRARENAERQRREQEEEERRKKAEENNIPSPVAVNPPPVDRPPSTPQPLPPQAAGTAPAAQSLDQATSVVLGAVNNNPPPKPGFALPTISRPKPKPIDAFNINQNQPGEFFGAADPNAPQLTPEEAAKIGLRNYMTSYVQNNYGRLTSYQEAAMRKQSGDSTLSENNYKAVRAARALMFQKLKQMRAEIYQQRGFRAAAQLRNANAVQLMGVYDQLPQVQNAQPNRMGGIIYASNGMLVNYQPQGTDTIPAMLSPGEFVVNAKSTAENLPLLQAINRADGGLSSDSSMIRNTITSRLSGDKQARDFVNLSTSIRSVIMALNQLPKSGMIQNLTINNNSNQQNMVDRRQNALGVYNQSTGTGGGGGGSIPIDTNGLKNTFDDFLKKMQGIINGGMVIQGKHDVNVIINGGGILQNLLSGPIGQLVQNAVQEAFAIKNRQNEGQ